MAFVKRRIKFLTLVTTGLLLLSGLAFSFFVSSPRQTAHASGSQGFYQQTNLVSDIAGVALFTDPNLVNAWGLSHPPTGPWWISDNGTGFSTLYNGNGRGFPVGSPLVVTIAPPGGSPAGTTAAPTGNIFNPVNSTNPDDFVVKEGKASGPSIFMFATEDGTISGWNPGVDLTNTILGVDRSTVSQGGFVGAVYKGLAFGQSGGNDFIYATNFRFGQVEMFNSNFQLKGSFTDSQLANTCPLPNQCFAPFGIQNIGGNLYVSFALQDAAHHDDAHGPSRGFVDVFDTNGNLIKRLISRGTLNSPWGLALAPANFGQFSNDLLVGNFGNGRINAFDPNTGALLGQLRNQKGLIISINGLWGLAFGNGKTAGPTNSLFFTAGINDEANGLFGKIESEN
jgi:uncharacterized protein (TIGR03118 family)